MGLSMYLMSSRPRLTCSNLLTQISPASWLSEYRVILFCYCLPKITWLHSVLLIERPTLGTQGARGFHAEPQLAID